MTSLGGPGFGSATTRGGRWRARRTPGTIPCCGPRSDRAWRGRRTAIVIDGSPPVRQHLQRRGLPDRPTAPPRTSRTTCTAVPMSSGRCGWGAHGGPHPQPADAGELLPGPASSLTPDDALREYLDFNGLAGSDDSWWRPSSWWCPLRAVTAVNERFGTSFTRFSGRPGQCEAAAVALVEEMNRRSGGGRRDARRRPSPNGNGTRKRCVGGWRPRTRQLLGGRRRSSATTSPSGGLPKVP